VLTSVDFKRKHDGNGERVRRMKLRGHGGEITVAVPQTMESVDRRQIWSNLTENSLTKSLKAINEHVEGENEKEMWARLKNTARTCTSTWRGGMIFQQLPINWAVFTLQP
jgi:hypothetical protein